MAYSHAVTAPGFDEPVLQAQQVFRALLTAQSQPGRIVKVDSVATLPPLYPATMALLLTLVDRDTPLWLDLSPSPWEAVSSHLRFHCGCPIVTAPFDAAFAVLSRPEKMPDFSAFSLGSDECPDRSTTLIIQVETLLEHRGRRWAGPGIADARRVHVAELPEHFWRQWRNNHALFPRGVDVIFTQADHLLALPRSVHVAEDN
ncbi:MAG: phosphonate C-P lyase system protein PhnH [Gammaproteobacteria bacterium]|nr:phosphonate C-P lyase system protein PhnH [Gammaproteobacteria bacterium]MCP5425043.1 phosphonate C-P lyase system protein PhnH [Gammaproteobacteria bacterium]MCP5459746.1 phosphonate C-P lyase system protein PhnH [Gammaproteobacteria bacterium]